MRSNTLSFNHNLYAGDSIVSKALPIPNDGEVYIRLPDEIIKVKKITGHETDVPGLLKILEKVANGPDTD